MKRSNKAQKNDWPPRRQREAALCTVDEHLLREPANIEAHFDRARLLTELGRSADARQAYLDLLARKPDHFGALNNLGALLHSTGYRTASRTCYAEAVKYHPDNPAGHVNLANALLEEEKFASAREHFERALELNPEQPDAHQGFANLLRAIGDYAAADEHRRLGFQNRAVTVLPFRGEGQPVPVLMLVSANGGNVPIRPFLDDRTYLVTVIVAEFYDTASPLPPHRFVFNAIGDADLCADALSKAQKIVAMTSAPVLNDPKVVSETGRAANAQRLCAIPGVITPRMIEVPRATLQATDALTALAALGFNTPLLVRAPGFHNGDHFHRIETADDLTAALDDLPGSTITIIQFLDARGADGKIRKYRVMIVNNEIYPLHAAIARDKWKIHYITADMTDSPEHRAEDEAFLNDMRGVMGPPAMAALEGIRDALSLDYAGLDFSLGSEGDVLLFEANATMVVQRPDPDPRWDFRREPVERIMNAVDAMLRETAED